MRNRRGYSLIEAAVSLALFTAITLAVMHLTQQARVNTDKAFTFGIRQASLSLMTQIIKRDGIGAALSYGNLTALDDDGKSFWTHQPTCAVDCTRKFTLVAGSRSLIVITAGMGTHPAVPIEPPRAYDVTDPAIPEQLGTLSFVSINKDGYLDGLAPGYWKPGNLLALYSVTPLNAYDASGAINLSIPARPIAYLGTIQDLRLQQVLQSEFVTTDPSGNPIPDEDVYLRRLTGAGGDAVFALAQPVQALMFELVSQPQGGLSLQRKIWDDSGGGGFTKVDLTLEGVQSVTFKRPTTAQSSFSFDIKMALIKTQ